VNEEILSRLERIDHKEYSCGFEFADSSTFDEMARCFEERKILAKEIERLNKELQDTKEHLGEYLHEQEEENKRLNNIIDKKEQFLGDNIKRLEREVVKRDNIINELKKQSNGVWVNNLLNFMEKNNIEFGSDKDATK